jgi:hypothetical protein
MIAACALDNSMDRSKKYTPTYVSSIKSNQLSTYTTARVGSKMIAAQPEAKGM